MSVWIVQRGLQTSGLLDELAGSSSRRPPSNRRMDVNIKAWTCRTGARSFGLRDDVQRPTPAADARARGHGQNTDGAKKRGIEKYQKALHGRAKLKDAKTLAVLQVSPVESCARVLDSWWVRSYQEVG